MASYLSQRSSCVSLSHNRMKEFLFLSLAEDGRMTDESQQKSTDNQVELSEHVPMFLSSEVKRFSRSKGCSSEKSCSLSSEHRDLTGACQSKSLMFCRCVLQFSGFRV